MTLTEFLLARIAEDEAVAESLSRGGLSYLAPNHVPGLGTVAALGRDRLLAECEAKRRIVDLHFDVQDEGSGDALRSVGCNTCKPDAEWLNGAEWPCETIRILAATYADHPDFDPAWRP